MARRRLAQALPGSPEGQPQPTGDTIGAHIRRARKAADKTLMEVAKAASLSVGYLSQVERDIITPSVSALKRIAETLGIPAGNLMFDLAGRNVTGAAVGIVRKGERKRIAFPQSRIEYELLTPDLRRRASLLWMYVPPRTESGPSLSHDGEDGVVVLKGTLRIEVAGVWHDLAEGDSIYFSSALPHRWKNEGAVPVEAIWLSTPPSF